MGRYDKAPEPGLLQIIWGLTWPILVIAFVISSFCYAQTDEYKQKQETQKMLRSEGVIIKKRVNPAGTNLGLFYRPDQWYLKVKLNNDEIIEVKVDKDRYMRTKIGDTIKFETY